MTISARFIDGALHPFDPIKIDAEIVSHQAADEDRRGLGVERDADALAGEILGRGDEPAIDDDEAVAKDPRGENGQRYEGQFLRREPLTYSELDISQASNSRRFDIRSKISRGLSMTRKLRSMPSGLMSPVCSASMRS